jgi:hypothetical protein
VQELGIFKMRMKIKSGDAICFSATFCTIEQGSKNKIGAEVSLLTKSTTVTHD